MKYVLSTATCSQKFVDYAPQPDGQKGNSPHVALRSVLIRGGANSPSAKSGFGELSNLESGQPIWTPSGVVTEVTDEDAKFLASNQVFQTGVKAGFYQIVDTNPGDSHKAVEKVVQASMTKQDASAPLTKETAAKQIKVSTKLDVEE